MFRLVGCILEQNMATGGDM